MTLLDAVRTAFGDQVTIDGTASMHSHSEVWFAVVRRSDGDIAAVVKRTWNKAPSALATWQQALAQRRIRAVQPLLPIVRVMVEGEPQNWVAYPFRHGRGWDGSAAQVAAAGRLLGQMHSASESLEIGGFPHFEWGNDARWSIDEDITAVTASADKYWPAADPRRWLAQLDVFGTEILPAARVATRWLPASMDHRASNLLFDQYGAAIVDLENAVRAPRIFDLAVAVLLFPLEDAGSAGRALSRKEWLDFLDGYLQTAPPLDEEERRLWPTALTYMKLEWGTWHLTEDVEEAAANLGYLEDLLTMDEQERFALPEKSNLSSAPSSHPTGLSGDDFLAIDAMLESDDDLRLLHYPGDRVDRQPIHTVYVPADRVTADLAQRWGEAAIAAMDEHAHDPAAFAAATGLCEADVEQVWAAITAKLQREPIEDLRVDLEDGYGNRPDDEEDAAAISAGKAIAAAYADGTLPPYVGVRFKSLEGPTRRRGLRSLDLILGAVLSDGDLPPGWVMTLPKVTSVAQVQAMAQVCLRLEEAYGLPLLSLKFEIQVETAQAILGADGTSAVAPMIHAAAGRCSGLHFGTYDYTAGVGIAGPFQAMDHPAADHAKLVMQLAAAGTGVRISDGSTNRVPVGDRTAVHQAWALHARLVRRSLERGIYQGWDLHPAQLPTRYLSTFLFYRDGFEALAQRLGNYLRGDADRGVLDEPATAKALAGFLVRGVHCGAVTGSEVKDSSGFELAAISELAGRRFG